MILRARLSEHLSPAEDRELLAAAATLSSRPAIIEECARVLGELVALKKIKDGFGVEPFGKHNNNAAISDYEQRKPLAWKAAYAAIRALAPREQNAATQAGQENTAAPSHEGHAAGPAVAAPNGAMDGDIVEFLCGGGTFKGCWYGGEKPSDEKGNFWWRKYLRAALRAAPSLSREEWGMLNAVLDDLADGLIGPSGWATLRAKVREWAKSRP
jgi:hypothetical protein